MEFLKEILGDELFRQVSEKINSYNGDESHKDSQVKIGNLSSGDYVGKGKYDALAELLKGKESELESATGLIAELKKSTKGNEELQGRIAEYESQLAELQRQLADTKIRAAVKVALLSEKAVDVDYLTFKLSEKLKEKGETLELDENDNIKGWSDKLSGLKVQFPTMFESSESGDGRRVYDASKLPASQGERTVTREDFLKMSYTDRLKLKTENEELYRTLMGR